MSVLFLIATALVVHPRIVMAESLARGFNDDIHWHNMADGLTKAKESNKPAMILIHKSTCGACFHLKEHFTSEELVDLSRRFAMINIENDEALTIDEGFSTMGQYVPRIIFVDPDGTIRGEKNVARGDRTPYYYYDDQQIIRSMKVVLGVIDDGKKTNGKTEEL